MLPFDPAGVSTHLALYDRVVLDDNRISDAGDHLSNTQAVFSQFVLPMLRNPYLAIPRKRQNRLKRVAHAIRLLWRRVGINRVFIGLFLRPNGQRILGLPMVRCFYLVWKTRRYGTA